MKRLYFLIPVACVVLLSACGKNGNKPANSQEAMMIGKWNLVKQTSSLYVDGAIKSASTQGESDTQFAGVEFRADHNFIATSYFNSGGIGNTSPGSVISADTVRGTFALTPTELKLSTPDLAGFNQGIITAGSGSPSVIKLFAHVVYVTELTAATLKLHVEYTTTVTQDATTNRYLHMTDYSYTLAF